MSLIDTVKRWNRRRLEAKRRQRAGLHIAQIHPDQVTKVLGTDITDFSDIDLTVGTRLTTLAPSQQRAHIQSLLTAVQALPDSLRSRQLWISAAPHIELPLNAHCPAPQPAGASSSDDLLALLSTTTAQQARIVIWVDEGCVLEPQALTKLLQASAAAKHRALIDANHFPSPHAKGHDLNTQQTPWAHPACWLIPPSLQNTLLQIGAQRPEHGSLALLAESLAAQALEAQHPVLTHPGALICTRESMGTPSAEFAPAHTLSVVIRYHDGSRLSELKRCLFSIACATYRHTEAVVVCQSLPDDAIDAIEAYAATLQPAHEMRVKVLNLPLPSGVDHRSALLNEGMQAASGKYLAFLDYDDCIRPQAYAALIRATQTSGSHIAFGDIAIRKAALLDQVTLIRSTERPWPHRNLFDLLQDNCCPIHSYVIDRDGIPPDQLRFDTNLSKYEDYDFLVRVCSQCRSDFSLIDTVVGDYYIKEDGSNSVITSSSFSREAKQAWQQSKDAVYNRRDLSTLGIGALTQVNEAREQRGLAALPHGCTVQEVNRTSQALRRLK